MSKTVEEDAPAPKTYTQAEVDVLVLQERRRNYDEAIIIVENLPKKKALDAFYDGSDKTGKHLKDRGAPVPGE